MKKYKILISALAYDNGKSGIADYINNVVKFLAEEHEIDLLIYDKDSHIFPKPLNNTNYMKVSDRLSSPLVSMFYHLFILPYTLPLNEYDFVFLPAGNRRLFSYYPKTTVVTFHDLSQFHIEGKYDALRMNYIKKVIPFYLKSAQIVMAISESTKRDIVKYYNFNEDKIEVNYNGYDPTKLELQTTLEELKKEYNLKEKFILYIGRIEHPGKNHLNLIKAYELLPANIKKEYKLVFAGSEWNGSEVVMEYAKKSADFDRIAFLGFVPDQHLGALYTYASLYTFPSFYEGFGIPLLEAMYCKTQMYHLSLKLEGMQ
ncbi:MAG: hypothetical protein B6226_01950 [Candidatus Cloacimonetes bacterium 4572_65]|nr:MAG: hypothetical protein B6226_01950 [Candidatus Cloacimonetes bacterium 4572_65]